MAQNVYSLNVVGYINLTLQPGLNLIANQLDVDGYMTNNTYTGVFSTNLPDASKVYAFNPVTGGYGIITWSAGSGNWIGSAANKAAVNAALTPGIGVWVLNNGASATNLTLVGNVIQGTNVTSLANALQVVSIIPPISTTITNAGYIPTTADKVFQFNPVTQGYKIHTYNGATGTWTGGGTPTPAVGEAFFFQPAVATNWVQAFTVQ